MIPELDAKDLKWHEQNGAYFAYVPEQDVFFVVRPYGDDGEYSWEIFSTEEYASLDGGICATRESAMLFDDQD